MLTVYIIITLMLWVASICVNILVISTSQERNPSAIVGLFINFALAIWAGSLLLSMV